MLLNHDFEVYNAQFLSAVVLDVPSPRATLDVDQDTGWKGNIIIIIISNIIQIYLSLYQLKLHLRFYIIIDDILDIHIFFYCIGVFKRKYLNSEQFIFCKYE